MRLTTFEGFQRDRLPQERIFSVESREYRMRVDYNSRGEFFTLRINDSESGLLVYTTNLIYFSPVITVYLNEDFRKWVIFPLDPEDLLKGFKHHESLTSENFYDGVKMARVEL